MTDKLACFNCNKLLDNHLNHESVFCLKDLFEKLSLLSEMLELKKIESEVASLATPTSDLTTHNRGVYVII